MILLRTIAMNTDYTYYGAPREVGRVTLYVDESLTDEQAEIAQQMQEERLLAMRKSELFSNLAREQRGERITWPRRQMPSRDT